ncbi:ribosomal L7Ae/L30e/S12e/Gadd45 family protein [Paenibacillus profundus]|uniref:Ribosomal L7Ae/L30e/S12e/Gadd45 family protein n=1 Tax=Paenibacillus profundus TaxID=1173085 RepID=A0ABS8YF12_9BACL|nr:MULTISPECIES: ribosomal L7Ae/L30e/S12e/Gadd45 family protein [Paenibacillus]MCE5168099.1 ribosomal L7Ae/L30e/S12e/Gadd45 family protein [Paenibacillus profundus]MCM3337347.1 ribosomal L7Ae/L30e/S12e/Gadd45 family protein [Paenibacillus sp. MER TA 81-3]
MSKLMSQLGLSRRAGKLVTGDENVMKAIRSKQARLVFVAGDASENTKKKFRDKCHSYSVPLVIGFDRMMLGESLGKAEQVVLAVTDHGFANMMQNGLKTMSEVEYID